MSGSLACRACGASMRGRVRWLCRGCADLGEAIFRESHSALDADWIRSRNQFFGTPAVVEAVRERLAQAAGAA